MNEQLRRNREKDKMRAAILEAATKIIIAEGYANLSMRKIAREIDYTATTIYNYYADKSQIIEAISAELYKKVVIGVKASLEISKNNSAKYRFEMCLKAFIFTLTENCEMFRAVIRSGSRAIFGTESQIKDPDNDAILILYNLLLEGKRKGVFRDFDENTPWMLVTALIGFSVNAVENQLHVYEEIWHDLVSVYTDLLLNGVVTKENDLATLTQDLGVLTENLGAAAEIS